MLNGGDLRVRRTRNGVLAVLRIQGVEVTGGCGYEEIADAVGVHDMEIGFSFRGIARGIARAATSVAKLRALQSIVRLAPSLPGPIGDVARMAGQAAKAIRGIRAGSRAALGAWNASRRIALANPQSPHAVAMRLAMDAAGRPVMGRAAVEPPEPGPLPEPESSPGGEMMEPLQEPELTPLAD